MVHSEEKSQNQDVLYFSDAGNEWQCKFAKALATDQQ